MTTTVNTLSCDVNSSIDFVLQGHQGTCEALSTPQNRYAIAQAVALLVEARQVGILVSAHPAYWRIIPFVCSAVLACLR